MGRHILISGKPHKVETELWNQPDRHISKILIIFVSPLIYSVGLNRSLAGALAAQNPEEMKHY